MKIELKRYAWSDCCEFDTDTGKAEFYRGRKIDTFTGFYHKDQNNFFVVYPTMGGPVMFYEDKEYKLHDKLNIILDIDGDNREFHIIDYDIHIKYKTPSADEWLTSDESDLFYRIQTEYTDAKFYDGWTK